MRAPPASTRAAWLALAASLFGHALLLRGERPGEAVVEVPPARALQVALLAPPLPRVPTAVPEPPPAAALRNAPVAVVAPAPAAPVVEPPVVSVVLGAVPELPPLRLAGPASWTYRLRQNGQDGEALLMWEPQDDGRYSLRLTRRIGERALPAQHSRGLMGMAGLAPERFALQQDGRDRQAVNFDSERGRLSFSASPLRLDLPPGAQDRLSWWLQLAALVQAAPAPGGRWRVWVAGPRGELREWVFEAVDGAPDEAGTLHLRRQTLGPHDPGIDVWLAPERGYWPVRLRQGDPETRGFEIVLADVNS